MRIHDISVPVVAGMPVWPGDPAVEVEALASIAAGDAVNLTRLSCCVHAGTHVDAPRHHVAGAAGVDELDLDVLVGTATVVEIPDEIEITAAVLDGLGIPARTRRLLLKTANSALWADPTHAFSEDFAALTPDAAAWVVEHGVRLLGVDYLSVQQFADERPDTHRILLEAGVVILEGACLAGVESGDYLLACLPVKIAGADGAPARAVLIDQL